MQWDKHWTTQDTGYPGHTGYPGRRDRYNALWGKLKWVMHWFSTAELIFKDSVHR